MTTRDEWRAQTGDAAFVDRLFAALDQLASPAIAIVERGDTLDPATAAKLAAMARKVREIGDGLRQKTPPDAEAAERLLAQIALTEEIARSMDELVTPDAADILEECARSIATEVASADADPADAAALAAEMVDTLATMDATARRVVLARPWPPVATTAMLQQSVGVERLVLATDLVAARGGATADLALTVGEVLANTVQAADDADAVLAADGVASALLAAIGGSAAVAGYAAALQTDPARLLRMPVPALLSCPVAMLHAAALSRFDAATATVLAQAALLQRSLAVTLDPSLLSIDPALAGLLDEYLEQVIAAGHAARSIAADSEDPDDLLTERGAALGSAGALEAYFRDPTPDDPLGTLPRVTVTALGAALVAARAGRSTDYDWERLADLEATRPDDYLILLEDERMEVMDLVL